MTVTDVKVLLNDEKKIQMKSVNRIPLKCIYRFIAYKSEIPNQILSLIK